MKNSSQNGPDVPAQVTHTDEKLVRVEVTTREDRDSDSPKILRFRKSERLVHWAIAVPFLVCFSTAIVLVFFYNPDPSRPYRDLFSWTHRISGLCLLILPIIAIFRSRGDLRIHFYNIGQAWIWSFGDVKWLLLKGLAAVNKKIQLPEQGKFNAAEKLNFMVLMGTYPLYVITGLAMWLTYSAVLAWIVHGLMAVLAAPLIMGHIYMAVINPATRKGLSGMFSGYVDRDWAKHHYTRWYRDHFENDAEAEAPESVTEPGTEAETLTAADEALEEFEAAIRELPLSTETEEAYGALHYYLGLASQDYGRIEKAVEHYESFLRQCAGDESRVIELSDARKRLAGLASSRGNEKTAARQPDRSIDPQ
ncbi:MAG: cytochrome b/b6 domain-containing protein [Candidatus Zixiibacteriota bacterium]